MPSLSTTAPYPDGNFWMRAIPATGCAPFANATDPKVGIVTYAGFPSSKNPMSRQSNFSLACSDEINSSLVPIVPWSVGPPTNNERSAL